jgi:transmembrane sensor
MKSRKQTSPSEGGDSEQRAAEIFTRRRFGAWTANDEAELQNQFKQDPALAAAFRRVEQSWAAIGHHAVSAEFMALREQAIARARRATARRWLTNTAKPWRISKIAAAAAALGIAAVIVFQFAPFGLRPGEYRTDIGEQKVVDLDDHSRIVLDAVTRLKVQFSKDARTVRLIQGQAQFSVAKDPARPFKVEAGGQTVVALGTVFTVEYVDREIHVAMLEGKVAILPPKSSDNSTVENPPTQQQTNPSPIEVTAGQELRVRRDGRATLTSHADLEAATAWRNGKVIFRKELLGEAVQRLNRYSRVKVEISDPALANMKVSGVFESGDTQTFVEAVQSYLSVSADYSKSGTIRLQTKSPPPARQP